MSEGFDFPSADQQALVRSYVSQLADKRKSIQGLWERVLVEPNDQVLLSELRLLVHRLAGSAGPYGFLDLGQAARALDDVLAPIARPEPPLAADPTRTVSACASLVHELLRALSAVR